MEEAIRQRIMDVLSANGSNPTKFSNGDAAMQKRLSRQLNGGAAVTFETISSILFSFPDISAEWLLRGSGDMFLSSSDDFNENLDTCQYVSKTKYESIVSLLADVSADLRDTVIENKHLSNRIAELENDIMRAQTKTTA